MELRHLRLFLKVVEHGSISAAAEELDMPQPILSRHIARLEKELSAKLLDRLPRGVRPNSNGEILRNYANSIDVNYRSALRQISSVQSASAGQINVGAGHSWLHGPLAVSVARLIERNPGARIRIVAAAADSLLPMLLRGDIDMALAPTVLTESYAGSFECESLQKTDLIVFAVKGHPATRARNLKIKDLTAFRWALPRGTFGRRMLDRLFERHDLPPLEPVIEVDDASALLDIVANSDLLTFGAPPHPSSEDWKKFAQIGCRELEAKREAGAIYRKDSTVPPLCHALTAELRAAVTESGLEWKSATSRSH